MDPGFEVQTLVVFLARFWLRVVCTQYVLHFRCFRPPLFAKMLQGCTIMGSTDRPNWSTNEKHGVLKDLLHKCGSVVKSTEGVQNHGKVVSFFVGYLDCKFTRNENSCVVCAWDVLHFRCLWPPMFARANTVPGCGLGHRGVGRGRGCEPRYRLPCPQGADLQSGRPLAFLPGPANFWPSCPREGGMEGDGGRFVDQESWGVRVIPNTS